MDSSGKLMSTDGDVTVERLWHDGAPVNITKLPLNKGIATYTLVPDRAHVNSTLNLVVSFFKFLRNRMMMLCSRHDAEFSSKLIF